jgi:hypothetical protein
MQTHAISNAVALYLLYTQIMMKKMRSYIKLIIMFATIENSIGRANTLNIVQTFFLDFLRAITTTTAIIRRTIISTGKTVAFDPMEII